MARTTDDSWLAKVVSKAVFSCSIQNLWQIRTAGGLTSIDEHILGPIGFSWWLAPPQTHDLPVFPSLPTHCRGRHKAILDRWTGKKILNVKLPAKNTQQHCFPKILHCKFNSKSPWKFAIPQKERQTSSSHQFSVARCSGVYLLAASLLFNQSGCNFYVSGISRVDVLWWIFPLKTRV